MASKTKEAAEATETREEPSEGPLMDSVVAAVKKLLQKAKERGYVSVDELNEAQQSELQLRAEDNDVTQPATQPPADAPSDPQRQEAGETIGFNIDTRA